MFFFQSKKRYRSGVWIHGRCSGIVHQGKFLARKNTAVRG